MKKNNMKPIPLLMMAVIALPFMLLSMILDIIARCLLALSYVIALDFFWAKREINDLLKEFKKIWTKLT